MATEHHPPQHGTEGYEHSDANVPSLFRFGAALAILIVAVMWAMVYTYNFLAQHESLGPPASPFENQRELPPQPRLQPQPATDLKSYCQMEELQLTTYGWVDQHNGVVRIPVDRAMEMVLQKGLPARAVNPSDSAAVHGESSGGVRRYSVDAATNPVDSMEPQVMGVAGPCGYLNQTTSQPAEPERGKE